MIIAEIPKANYCSFFCFLLTMDECMINVWGYTEILPRQQMEDYGFSVSRWQNTDSILSTINCLQTLYLFRFNIDIPVAAIDDRGLQAATKHGRSRTRKVCLVLMLTKICGDKTFRDRDPSWFFFSPG